MASMEEQRLPQILAKWMRHRHRERRASLVLDGGKPAVRVDASDGAVDDGQRRDAPLVGSHSC